ncbi:cation diffusion facilitator family transporter [Bacteriovorax sp. PP10]|uniref:Cation diffusion facilitator family transporter n=1 Tax=Bacteriovorax antarcticus TaxID=3088717 RepID=A0ABU5VTB6_9BACT|nr:cation diffusion facilitator family transporter [Bacteriovorax sp. PP10]MEA9355847.1 cation diffusion facilitator family transporter [Bacteriovorax sp. PP10]
MEVSKSHPHNSRGDKEKIWIPVISLIVGIVLLFFKFYAYKITNSQSIYSDALESIVNIVAGIITLIVIVVAAKPADDDHPYGHGKVESMAASFEGGAILFAGLLIILKAVEVYYRGEIVTELDMGLLITVGTGVANGLMGYIILIRGKKLHSEALRSSGTHLMTDMMTSIGVVISLVLVKFTGYMWIDPVIAIIFGFMLCISGAKILIRSGYVLMDGLDKETLQVVAKLFEKNYRPGVIDIHYTRVIRSGSFHHIDCHMVIPEFWTVSEAHYFSDNFDMSFLKDYPVEAELRIHLDPCRRVYCENCEVKDCPIRKKDFIKRISLDNMEEVTSPIESR